MGGLSRHCHTAVLSSCTLCTCKHRAWPAEWLLRGVVLSVWEAIIKPQLKHHSQPQTAVGSGKLIGADRSEARDQADGHVHASSFANHTFPEFLRLQGLEENVLPDSRQALKDDWHLYEYASEFLQMDANAALRSRVAANISGLVFTCVLFTLSLMHQERKKLRVELWIQILH